MWSYLPLVLFLHSCIYFFAFANYFQDIKGSHCIITVLNIPFKIKNKNNNSNLFLYSCYFWGSGSPGCSSGPTEVSGCFIAYKDKMFQYFQDLLYQQSSRSETLTIKECAENLKVFFPYPSILSWIFIFLFQKKFSVIDLEANFKGDACLFFVCTVRRPQKAFLKST